MRCLSSALAVCRDDSILDYRGGTLVTGRGRCTHNYVSMQGLKLGIIGVYCICIYIYMNTSLVTICSIKAAQFHLENVGQTGRPSGLRTTWTETSHKVWPKRWLWNTLTRRGHNEKVGEEVGVIDVRAASGLPADSSVDGWWHSILLIVRMGYRCGSQLSAPGPFGSRAGLSGPRPEIKAAKAMGMAGGGKARAQHEWAAMLEQDATIWDGYEQMCNCVQICAKDRGILKTSVECSIGALCPLVGYEFTTKS